MDKIDSIVTKYPYIWKTRAAFFSFVKGILRKGWNHHPAKIEYINSHREQIPNPNPKGKKPTVWGGTCEVCGGKFPSSEMEVDHILEETAKLTKLEDIQLCAEKLLVVEDTDLRWICKGCHAANTLAQKLGISFQEALVEKKVIAFKKLSSVEQIKVLTEEVKLASIPSNAAKRVDAYRKFLKGE